MTKIADPSVMAKNVIKFGPPPQIDKEDDDDASRDTFTLFNSFWFVIASLLQQGTDLLPRAVSTR